MFPDKEERVRKVPGGSGTNKTISKATPTTRPAPSPTGQLLNSERPHFAQKNRNLIPESQDRQEKRPQGSRNVPEGSLPKGGEGVEEALDENSKVAKGELSHERFMQRMQCARNHRRVEKASANCPYCYGEGFEKAEQRRKASKSTNAPRHYGPGSKLLGY